MHRSRPRPRTALVALALLIALLGVACGVDTTDDASLGGTGGGGQTGQTGTTLPPCEPEEGGGTGGLIGMEDLDPTCEPVAQPDTDEPDTTEPDDEEGDDPVTTTEPDGGSEGSPDQVYLDAMIESLQEGQSDDLSFSDAEAECLAPLWLETITVDALREADITPEDLASDDTDVDLEPLLDQDQGIEMVEAFDTCGIDLEQLFLAGLNRAGSIEIDQVACLADALPDGYVDQLFAITFADGEDALDANPELAETLTDAFTGCTE